MFSGSGIGLAWGAVFTLLLASGCVTDLRSRRIPNGLVLAIVASGLLHSASAGPVMPSLGWSLAGVAAGLGIWIVFYIGGVMGAGDVKFFAAAGSWLGPSATWRAALIAAVAGGVLAILFLLRERRLSSTVRRMALAIASRSPGVVVAQEEPTAAARQRLPYGVALAVGALLAAWFPK
jgi:prepilin peptidase CpaA